MGAGRGWAVIPDNGSYRVSWQRPRSAPAGAAALPPNPLAPPAAGPPPLRAPNLSGARSDRALIRSWLALKPSPHTQRAYARAVQDFLAWSDSTPLAAVTVTRLQAWRAHLETRLAPTSVNARLAALKSLLAYAQRTGYLPLNVGAALAPRRVPARLAERILPERDALNLLAAAGGRTQGPRNRALLLFLYYTGARLAEALGLQWRDLTRREDGATAAALHGKGGRTRYVALPPACADALWALQPPAAEPAGYVFRTRHGRPLDARAARGVVRAAARRAGLQAPVSPHWLRHAHASHALDRGAAVHEVQQTLGHASLATTSRYVHLRPDRSSGHALARLDPRPEDDPAGPDPPDPQAA